MSAPKHLGEGRVAIVTGAASGLGQQVSYRLARDRWHVVLADVADSSETHEGVHAAGGTGQCVTHDVTSEASWRDLADALKAQGDGSGNLDLLVNNAGIVRLGDVGQLPLDDWRKVMDVNLFGAVTGCHVLADNLKNNPRGAHIVNVSSIMGFTSGPSLGAYSASKAGLIAFSETLFAEWRRFGVGVSVVCPGHFKTDLLKNGSFCTEQQRTVAQNEQTRSSMSAEGVAEALVGAVYRQRFYVMEPFVKSRIPWFGKRMMPRLFLKFVERIGRSRFDAAG